MGSVFMGRPQHITTDGQPRSVRHDGSSKGAPSSRPLFRWPFGRHHLAANRRRYPNPIQVTEERHARPMKMPLLGRGESENRGPWGLGDPPRGSGPRSPMSWRPGGLPRVSNCATVAEGSSRSDQGDKFRHEDDARWSEMGENCSSLHGSMWGGVRVSKFWRPSAARGRGCALSFVICRWVGSPTRPPEEGSSRQDRSLLTTIRGLFTASLS